MTSTHERIKTVLLAVLIIGAVFMAYSTWFYDNPMGDRSIGALIGGNTTNIRGDYSMQSQTVMSKEIAPMRISVKNEYGRFGAEHSSLTVDAAYSATRGLMAEALSVLNGSWEKTDENAWRSALGNKSVLYDYQGMVRADIVSEWLWGGTSEAGEIKGRYVLLSLNPKNDKTIVMIKNPYTGEIYQAETAVDNLTAQSIIDAVAGESHYLAFELEGTDYTRLVPESFIRETNKISAISGFNAAAYLGEEQKLELLKSFGFATYSVSEHIEGDGTRVYIEEDATVRIGNDGFVLYTYTGTDEQAGISVQSAKPQPSAAEIFETARLIVSRLSALCGGSGEIYAQDFRYFPEYDCWVADFGWSVNRVPVDRQDTGYAARVVIRGMRVSEVEFYMRAYQSTDRPAKVINKKLATAALSPEEKDCELELRYTDGGQPELEPAWYRKDEE